MFFEKFTASEQHDHCNFVTLCIECKNKINLIFNLVFCLLPETAYPATVLCSSVAEPPRVSRV